MTRNCMVFVSKPKECRRTFNAEVVDNLDGEIIYGVGSTPREAINDLLVMVEEINQSRERDGKELLNLTFDYCFDIASLFSFYSYLNISEVARRMGINPALMRRYASGETIPSKKRIREIEVCLKEMALELSGINLMPKCNVA